MESKLNAYIEKFNESGEKRYAATESGNSKLNNIEYKKIKQIFEIAKKATQREREVFYNEILKKYNNPSTLNACCTHMLLFNIDSDLAIRTLQELSQRKDINPLVSFSSEMIIEEWENGSLVTY